MARSRDSTSISPACRAAKRSASRQRAELHGLAAAECGGGQCPAEVDVDAGPGALLVDGGIALGPFADAAQHMPAGAHRLQRAGLGAALGSRDEPRQSQHGGNTKGSTQEGPHAVVRAFGLSSKEIAEQR